ncbi:Strictosidine synthase, conserved region [Dillenia turbinata]|uniref:Strictosidine synthase, conserved region n=1 Tax=Dillenia turbinata TaxID=194707 RepID=A0AAN8VXN6_9MAGN
MNKAVILASILIVFVAFSIVNFKHTGPSQPYSFDNVKKVSIDQFRSSEILPINGAVGPESFAFDPAGGGPYVGVSDGRIIKWDEDQRGLKFNEVSGDLYIADAYLGLFMIGPKGGQATRLATEAQGIPFKLANGLDIDQTSGVVYFTDSSSRFQRRNYMLLTISGERSGRLIKYDPRNKQVTVLLDNLQFPNGVVLSKDGDFILISETATARILKFWLKTSKAGNLEVFAQLPGFPDNIKLNNKGEYWVGIFTRRGKFLHWILSEFSIGKKLLKLPLEPMTLQSILAKWRASGFGVKLSGEGQMLEILEDGSRKVWRSISEIEERNGTLWVGSVLTPYAGKYSF